jgi:hypothetical protein
MLMVEAPFGVLEYWSVGMSEHGENGNPNGRFPHDSKTPSPHPLL